MKAEILLISQNELIEALRLPDDTKIIEVRINNITLDIELTVSNSECSEASNYDLLKRARLFKGEL